MAVEDLLEKLGDITRCDGAPQAAIDALQRWAGGPLPESYLNLLKITNGAEGSVAEHGGYLMLWPAEKVPEYNEGYCAGEFVPGLILIGSNGGGEAFALDTRIQPMAVRAVPFIVMSLDDAELVGSDFEDFLRRLPDGLP